MMNDEQAKEKAKILQKFRDEQSERMGGNKTFYFSCILVPSFYFGSSLFMKVEKVPLKILWGLVGYTIGVNLGIYLFGNSKHQVYYTRHEFDIVRNQFGEQWTRNIKIIDGDNDQEKQELKIDEQ